MAVVGSGIAGLAAARSLAATHTVTLFEAGDHFGGHAHTVDVKVKGQTAAVDCGFLVFNERTYPKLIALFTELGVESTASDMSFSVQVPNDQIEWSGSSLATVFAQRRNLFRPGFLWMLSEVLRFNRLATAIAQNESRTAMAVDQSIGDFLATHAFSKEFRDWYFLPMIGCVWSCSPEQMLAFPLATLIRFCHNHGLLQIFDRPAWRTVTGGSRRYVAKMLEPIFDSRLNAPVRLIRRLSDGGVELTLTTGKEHFDAVVLACHSDEALTLLADPSAAEREVLGAIAYQPNRAVLHTDTSVLPRRQSAWAAWNYERGAVDGEGEGTVCLHYLINRLQPLPFTAPVIVSLNPVREPAGSSIEREFMFSHPVFDRAAISAQARLAEIQGCTDTWFCGAWTRYGFHEDGLASGLAVAAALKARAGLFGIHPLTEASF